MSNTILFVCVDPLVPVTGGGASRIFTLIDYLRGVGYRVELATLFTGKKDIAALEERVDRVWYPREVSREAALVFMLRQVKRLPVGSRRERLEKYFEQRLKLVQREQRSRIVEGDPHSYIIRKIIPSVCRLVRQIAAEQPLRAVVSEYVWTARVLDELPEGVLRIVDTIDVQHQRRQRALAAGGDLPGHRCTREEEVQELNRADALLAIQRHEQRIFKELCPDRHVLLVEHAVETLKQYRSPKNSRKVFLVGNMYDPNVIGAREFMNTAWPKIRAALPESEFIICGKLCEAFQEVPEGVRLEGVVPSLEPYYAEAAVVVNPVPYGSGLKIKSVEALTHGKCLVTTPIGVYGLEDALEREPRPCIVTEVSRMAVEIVELLKRPERRQQLEQEAWHYARRRFSPKNVYRALEAALQEPQRYLISAAQRAAGRKPAVALQGPQFGVELLENGQFRRWDGDEPAGWTLAPSAEFIKARHGGSGDESPLALLPPKSNRLTCLYQRFQFPTDHAGARLAATMQAKCSEPGKCALVVTMVEKKPGGKPLVFKADHPGDGKWHALKVELTLPGRVQDYYIRINGQLRAGAKEEALLRTLTAKLLAPAKKQASPAAV